jgi:ADP-ribose pyrophosphatase
MDSAAFSAVKTESQTIGRKIVYEGRLLTLQVDTVVEDGRERQYEVVTHAGAAVILPVPQTGRLILVEQWRHSIGRRVWEVPAGLIEPGEDPHTGALRELREETGYTAGRLRSIGAAFTVPGFCDELLHIFVAEDLTPGERDPDEGEESMVVRDFQLSELNELVAQGGIVDLKTLFAIAWLQSPLNRAKPD